MFGHFDERVSLELAAKDTFDVRECLAVEQMGAPFHVDLVALSASLDVDFEAIIGDHARVEIRQDDALSARVWTGVCESIELLAVEPDGLSTYAIRVVPRLWLLSQRRGYRIFQDQSELEIVLSVLREWGIAPELRCGTYPSRRYRTQYAESDLAFVQRLLEDIGVAHHFEQIDGETKLVLADAPNRETPRAIVPFVAAPTRGVDARYVTRVTSKRRVRPGRYTQSDVDYRKPLDYPLAASFQAGSGAELGLERYQHDYGSFLWKGGLSDTPHADDRGPARTDEILGHAQVRRRLEAERADADVLRFGAACRELAPGVVMRIAEHPRGELARPLLVVASTIRLDAEGNWTQACEAVFADRDYRPPFVAPRPRVQGIESATVTGPLGEEIHTDELGRVRVRFHWDRGGPHDETSSCWLPVSQPWAGSGFGAVNIPRVGQEVLVDFLGADPDRPLVVGRVFTMTNPPPYKLPEHRMVGGMRSESYPKPKPAQAKAASAKASENVVAGVVGAAAGSALASAAQQAASAIAAKILPGLFGGPQADLEAIQAAVGGFAGHGPDGVDVTRSASGLMMNDTADAEQVMLQSQRDLSVTSKNNSSMVVGANAVASILGNSYKAVAGFLTTHVGVDRAVTVGGSQTHNVFGDIVVNGFGTQITTIASDTLTETVGGGQVFKSAQGIIMTVADSASIFMLPDGIVIDAKAVFINPGAVMVDALKKGLSVTEAAKAAQAVADAAKLEGDARAFMRDYSATMIGPYEAPMTSEDYDWAAQRDRALDGGFDPGAPPGDHNYGALGEFASRQGYSTAEEQVRLYQEAARLMRTGPR